MHPYDILHLETGALIFTPCPGTKNTIAIHCKGGSGRTGLMAALIMRMMDMPLADVKAKVKQLRPKALSIPLHLHFLDTFLLMSGDMPTEPQSCYRW
ncbi:protein-tyrosine phosphatase family protein [Aliikangiella sp. IMCC44359]|uniref:protein-tyrosine phosphatase family protein n=1 Tax=Aliikangiella sp. IMCC44359 TaxID=3459125 RepID=UPI00403AE364